MAAFQQDIPHLRSHRGIERAKFSPETRRIARENLVTDPFDPNLSENRRWLSVADLLGPFADAKIAVLGVPLGEGSITAGRCDLGPAIVRAALKRISTYDLETGTDLSGLRLFDAGDVELKRAMPADVFAPIRDAVTRQLAGRDLVVLIGGNNAITRPGVHGIAEELSGVGLITFDAHFDLRDTDLELNNGNPIQALLEDGLPGENISQIGLAPFANTKKAHSKAKAAGISVHTLADCRAEGFAALVARELDRLSKHCDRIYIDCDIDVIDRAQMPAAPGSRPGGIAADAFFGATRLAAAHPKVKCIDLAEFDPSTDINATGALTAARWLAEVASGYAGRPISPPRRP
jgi:formiminoglutamase